MTGMLFDAGAGAFVCMPGSTPPGGRITPELVRLIDGAAGAICSGGVGDIGGIGPGGACVLEGGLDGCASAANGAQPKAMATAKPPAERRPARGTEKHNEFTMRSKRPAWRAVRPRPQT